MGSTTDLIKSATHPNCRERRGRETRSTHARELGGWGVESAVGQRERREHGGAPFSFVFFEKSKRPL